MSFPNYKYGTGLNNVGSYQVSGKPFATGTLNALDNGTIKVSFPSVTRWIYVVNHGATHCRVGFSDEGVTDGTNFFRVGPQAGNEATQFTQRLELKVTEIYLSGSNDVDVLAGLTGVDIQRVDNLSDSGTNWSGSVGVG